ncbi:hypothetical protein MJG53_020299, partial [Ovis ammon polii x Ovis aries]
VGSWDHRQGGRGVVQPAFPLKGVAGSSDRLDTSLPGSVFLSSIINHRNQADRTGVLAITFCSLKEPAMDFKRVKDYLSWLYYQYQIISCCAVLEPWEQSMFNTIILTIFAMVVYTAYVFIPIHIRLAWEFFSKMCGYHSTISN